MSGLGIEIFFRVGSGRILKYFFRFRLGFFSKNFLKNKKKKLKNFREKILVWLFEWKLHVYFEKSTYFFHIQGFQIPDPSLWCMYFSWFCVSEYEWFIEKFLSNFTGWSGNPTKLASVNKPLAWQDQNYKILKCINSKRTPQIYSKSYISNGHTEEQ